MADMAAGGVSDWMGMDGFSRAGEDTGGAAGRQPHQASRASPSLSLRMPGD